MNIEDEDVYMVLLMSLPPSFDNLVTSLESMQPRMLTFYSLSLDCFMRFPKEKKVKVNKFSCNKYLEEGNMGGKWSKLIPFNH